MFFVQQSPRGIEYRSLSGDRVNPERKGKTVLLLNLKDCLTVDMELPPLKDADKAVLIGKRLPAHFPLALSDWEWCSLKTGEITRIFLIRKELMMTLRTDWGKKVMLVSTASYLPDKPVRNLAAVHSPDGTDLFVFKEGRLDHALHCISDDEYREVLSGFPTDEPAPFEINVLKERIPEQRLFHEEKKVRGGLALILAFLITGALLLTPLGTLRKREYEVALLKEQVTLRQEEGRSRNDAIPWEEIEKSLSSHSPPDRYGQLEALYPLFKGKGEILNYSISGKDFQIQARGRSPLLILEDLKGLPGVAGVSLYQSREEETLEIFNFSGSWE
jgi:hypothetical protein